MCNIAPGMPHEITGLQPTRNSMANSSGFFRELVRSGSVSADEAYYRRYDPDPDGDKGTFDGQKGRFDQCKGNGSSDLIFVTGYFGAPIEETAKEIAEQEGMDLLILDRAIEKKDGRSIRRICMAGGEHGYRNLEFEAVEELTSIAGSLETAELRSSTGSSQDQSEPAGGCLYPTRLVIACGDGILYDEQTRELILDHDLIIVGDGLKPDRLWEGALADEETWHAFMLFGSDKEKRAAFEAYHERQKELFSQVRGDLGRRG